MTKDLSKMLLSKPLGGVLHSLEAFSFSAETLAYLSKMEKRGGVNNE